MQNKIFVDSNIWLYLLLQDDNKKYKIAEEFFQKNNLNSTFVITYQVVNEVSNILLKNEYTETKIRESIDNLFRVCTVQEFTKEIIFTASTLRDKYSFSFWDSILAGSALFSKCDMLISEDMQHGQLIENSLTILNPFK